MRAAQIFNAKKTGCISELHYFAPEVRRALKSPETRNGKNAAAAHAASLRAGHAADIYAFGAILYECIYLHKVRWQLAV